MAAMLWETTVPANEVYIEQIGSSSTLTITQQGTDNKLGTSISSAFIGGGSNTVTIDQIGSLNNAVVTVNGAATNLSLSVTGSQNTQEVSCGTIISASCSGSTISQTITGDSNNVIQTLGAGANHISNITVLGNTNDVTHTSTSTGATTANITVTGDTNTIGVTQGGTLAQTVTVNSTGNNNNISINQSN